MRILISCIACSPYGASESIYGWRACRAIASDHDLWILTSARFRPDLERATQEGLVLRNMHFFYVGNPAKYADNRLVARAQSWLEYMTFQREQMAMARELHAKVNFDVAHLVTYTTWRVGCPLWQLGLPLIWGPISGTEKFPLQFLGILSWSSRAFEFARILQSWVGRLSPTVRACADQAACIPTTHRQAYDWIARIRGREDGVSVFCNVFFADQYIRELQRQWPEKPHDGVLRIFASGHLEGRKGVALAFRALARAKARGLKFTYRITSRGPEFDHLMRLRSELGLESEVDLGTSLPRPEFLATLRASDVYLLPSLREGAGQTMMEAMLGGCVPVVANWGGPAEIVTDECGYRVPVTNVVRMTEDISSILLQIDGDRRLLLEKGRAAERRIAENYNEQTYRQTINAAYDEAAAKGRKSIAEPSSASPGRD